VFSFRLSDEFIQPYKERQVPWGYTDAGGNSVGEITFLRTYSGSRRTAPRSAGTRSAAA
jgi:ribonucleoside-triphosphate reductase